MRSLGDSDVRPSVRGRVGGGGGSTSTVAPVRFGCGGGGELVGVDWVVVVGGGF